MNSTGERVKQELVCCSEGALSRLRKHSWPGRRESSTSSRGNLQVQLLSFLGFGQGDTHEHTSRGLLQQARPAIGWRFSEI
jgi:hypothetical protein